MLAAVLVNLGLSAAAGGAAWRWMVGLPAIPGVTSGETHYIEIILAAAAAAQQSVPSLQGARRLASCTT
jgi:hypothetical protein